MFISDLLGTVWAKHCTEIVLSEIHCERHLCGAFLIAIGVASSD